MKTLIITAVALGLGLLSSPTFASVVDPDPAGIGTYLVSAVLLTSGIVIFLHSLIRDTRANRGQKQECRFVPLRAVVGNQNARRPPRHSPRVAAPPMLVCSTIVPP